jgi:LacI family transcriptional regulator
VGFGFACLVFFSEVVSVLRQVLLVVESSRAYGRGCLAGIASYVRAHGTWDVVHLERGLEDQVPDLLHRRQFDGVIARIENRRIADSIVRFEVPIVDLRGTISQQHVMGSLDTDAAACAQMAWEHFHDCGLRQFAFCGYSGIDFSDDRSRAFAEICRQQGFVSQSFATEELLQGTLANEREGDLTPAAIELWLQTLPRPIGIFACNDVRGRQVLAAARRANLVVPDEVAVLGVDDDEIICDLAATPLSSIEPDTHRIGFAGAEMLDKLMSGERVAKERVHIAPLRVAARLSTDLLALEDPDLTAALRFIRGHACDPISVTDVLAQVAMSRATLERRFKQVLKRSPREEIERVRINRIRLLLGETDYSLTRIARLTGYRTLAHMTTAFRRHHDEPPGHYRRRQGS